MSLAPLLNAAPAIQIHLAAATAALLTGAAVAVLAKGTATHLLLGRIAAAGIVIASVSSIWIRTSGGFSWIHLLSIVSLVSVARGIWYRRQGNVTGHKYSMFGAYLGLLVAGAFAAAPSRLLGQLLHSG